MVQSLLYGGDSLRCPYACAKAPESLSAEACMTNLHSKDWEHAGQQGAHIGAEPDASLSLGKLQTAASPLISREALSYTRAACVR